MSQAEGHDLEVEVVTKITKLGDKASLGGSVEFVEQQIKSLEGTFVRGKR